MMKIICKTILISIISSMLMLNDLIAFAQVQQGQMLYQNNGTYTQTNTVNLSGVKDDDVMSTLTMVAIGFIVTRLYNYSKLTTDMMLAAAGGTAFIVGEVMTNNGYNEIAQSQSRSLTMSNDASKQDSATNAQLEDLKKLKKSYEDAKATAEKKKTLQTAAATAFAAAGVMALWERLKWGAAFTEFEAKIEATGIACPPAAATGNEIIAKGKEFINKAEAKDRSLTNQKALKDFETSLTTLSSTFVTTVNTFQTTMRATVEGTAAAEACQKAFVTTTPAKANLIEAITTKITFGEPIKYSGTASIGNTVTLIDQIIKNHKNAVSDNISFKKNLEKNYLKKIINLFIPSAIASDANLLFGVVGATVGYLLVEKYGIVVDTFLFTPAKRALVWGILAGLTKAAGDATQANIDDMVKHSNDIDKLINSLSNMQTTPAIASTSGQQVVDLSGAMMANVHTPDVNIVPSGTKASCTVSNGESHCTSLTAMIASSPDFAGLPPSFQNVATQIGNLGNGLSGTGTLSGATMGNATTVAGQAHAIGKLLKDEQSKLNSLLGDEKINFAGEQKQLLSDLNNVGADAIKKSGLTPSKFLASIGAMPISGVDMAIAKTDEAPIIKKASAAAGSSAVSTKTNKGQGFKFLPESNPDGVAAAASAPDKSANVKYDMGITEINQNSKVSIFELISTRYFKSAFPKLLEEDNSKK